MCKQGHRLSWHTMGYFLFLWPRQLSCVLICAQSPCASGGSLYTPGAPSPPWHIQISGACGMLLEAYSVTAWECQWCTPGSHLFGGRTASLLAPLLCGSHFCQPQAGKDCGRKTMLHEPSANFLTGCEFPFLVFADLKSNCRNLGAWFSRYPELCRNSVKMWWWYFMIYIIILRRVNMRTL